jgi:hypothetical protein
MAADTRLSSTLDEKVSKRLQGSFVGMGKSLNFSGANQTACAHFYSIDYFRSVPRESMTTFYALSDRCS